jgi:two-component system, sensor histidine kinase PdtaS
MIKGKGKRNSNPRAELAALRDIGRALSSAWDLSTTLQAISATTTKVMRVDCCSIYLLDEARQSLVLKASTGLSATAVNQARLQLGEGISGYAAQSGKPIALRDAAKDARFKFLPETDEQRFKSLLAVPLINRGRVIGTMNVRNSAFHRWARSEIDLLTLIGDLAAGALERAKLHDGLQRQIQELSTLAQVSQTITAPLYLDEMLRVVVEMAAQIMRARATALLLFDEERGELVLRAAHGLSRGHAVSSPIRVQNSLTGEAIMRGEPVVVRDLSGDTRYRNRELAREEGLCSFLAVPLRVRDKVIGAFNCYMDEVHDFGENEIELFSTLANQTALALENANLAMNSMLVREMHHRVKNNLQMVAMLLRLQLRNGREISPREVLHQTINRILSIAAVHEALSQEGFRLIGVKGLIQQAALVATQNMVRAGQEIRVLVDGADIRLPSQPATTLAIAANELIQNALEHGFGERERGTVQVRLLDGAGEYGLEVSDDGLGLPEDFDLKDSLGLQIVETLATEDLHGEFELGANRDGVGTRATLRLPKLAVVNDA